MSVDYSREDAHLRRITSNENYGFSSYRQNGNMRANEIMELLRQDPRLSVARCVITGSIGKGTSLGVNNEPDYDIVVFLNRVDFNATKPFENQLKIFREILDQSGKYKITFVSAFAVGCQHKVTGLELDIKAAVNFYDAHSSWGQTPSGVQLKKVLELLEQSREELHKHLYSSAEEAVVDFIKDQPQFVRDVVIIGKLWNKFRLGNIDCYVSGRSSIIELVAIRAALDEMKRSSYSPSHFRALKLFLSILATDMNQVQVFFEYNLLPSFAKSKFNTMKTRRGIILDPVNPYRNFMDETGVYKAWPNFSTAAQQCLNELKAHENRPYQEQHVMLRLDKVVPSK